MKLTLKCSAGIPSAVLASIFFMSCSHTTRFVTEPQGARIYVNDVSRGETPTFFESRSGTPTTYHVKITAPGYETIETPVRSAYRADLSLLLLLPGIVPYFFSARLEDSYTFPLVPLTEAGTTTD